MEQLKLIFEFKLKTLPIDLLKLFILNSEVNNYNTRNVSNEGLFIPRIHTTSFGNKSLRYSAPLLWNNFLKVNPKIKTFKKLDTFKRYLKKLFLESYND